MISDNVREAFDETYNIDEKQKTLVEILNDLDSLSEEQTPQNLYIGANKLSNMISVRMDEITGLIKLKAVATIL